MQWEVTGWGLVLCASHSGKPVNSEGTEGRNEIRVRARQTSSFGTHRSWHEFYSNYSGKPLESFKDF